MTDISDVTLYSPYHNFVLTPSTKDSLDKVVPEVASLKSKDESAKIVSNGHQTKGISFDVSPAVILVKEKNLTGYNYSLIRTTDGNKVSTGIISGNEIGIGDIDPGTYLLICSGGESNFVNFITKPRP